MVQGQYKFSLSSSSLFPFLSSPPCVFPLPPSSLLYLLLFLIFLLLLFLPFLPLLCYWNSHAQAVCQVPPSRAPKTQEEDVKDGLWKSTTTSSGPSFSQPFLSVGRENGRGLKSGPLQQKGWTGCRNSDPMNTCRRLPSIGLYEYNIWVGDLTSKCSGFVRSEMVFADLP